MTILEQFSINFSFHFWMLGWPDFCSFWDFNTFSMQVEFSLFILFSFWLIFTLELATLKVKMLSISSLAIKIINSNVKANKSALMFLSTLSQFITLWRKHKSILETHNIVTKYPWVIQSGNCQNKKWLEVSKILNTFSFCSQMIWKLF